MKKSILLCFLLLAGPGIFAQTPSGCGPWNFPSFNLPADEGNAFKAAYPGETFKLSQEYPATNKVNARALPWERFDLSKEAEKYMKTLIAYCFEGMDEAKWVVQNNKVRKWYHTPFLETTKVGREPVHGLVMNRAVAAGELSPEQTSPFKTYSISFYNEAGGYTIGKVWCDPKTPDPTQGIFPAGTVAVKLTFAAADSTVVPFLANGPLTWDAWIDPVIGENRDKKMQAVRLLEVDIAVKTDNPKVKTGWVYATYVFDGALEGKTLAEKFAPLGLSWGQDEKVTARDVMEAGTALQDQWVNTRLFNDRDRSRGRVKHLGWGDRVAGLIDGRGSSCQSCHSTAGYTMKGFEMIPPDTMDQDSMLRWYRNLRAPAAFWPEQVSLDYSLGLAASVRNYYDSEGKYAGEIVFRGSVKDLMDLFTKPKVEEEKVVIETGLSTGRRMTVFIFFVALIAVLAGLLVYNLFKKN